MALTSLLKAPILSLYSKRFYLNVITKMNHNGIIYLSVLMFIATALFSITVNLRSSTISVAIQSIDQNIYQPNDSNTEYSGLSVFWQNFVDIIVQLPTITVDQGVASADVTSSPSCIYSLRDPQQALMCIDTENTINYKESEAPLLLTKHRLIYNNPHLEEPQSIYEFKHLGIYEKKVITIDEIYAELLKLPLMTFFYSMILILPVLIAMTLFYAWVAVNLSEYYKLGLRFKDCLRVAAIANGTMIIIFTVVIITGLAALSLVSSIAILLPIFCQYRAYRAYHDLLRNSNDPL